MPPYRFLVAAGAATIGLALPALPALAQSSGDTGNSGFPDLVPVAVWTCVAAVIALSVVSVGYLYRRERGIDRPLKEPPVPLAAAIEAHDESRDAAGYPLPAHVVEHSPVPHDDATQQAHKLTATEAEGN